MEYEQVRHAVYQALGRRGLSADSVLTKVVKKSGKYVEPQAVDKALQALVKENLVAKFESANGKAYLYAARGAFSRMCKI